MKRLLCLAMLVAAPLHAQAVAPELPRSVPTTVTPAPTRTLVVAGSLQTAIDSAKDGDAIELACGSTYTGTYWVRNRGAGTGWVTLRAPVGSACDPKLPRGVRLTDTVAQRLNLPKIVTDNGDAALKTARGAGRFRVTGIEITMTRTLAAGNAQHYGLISLGGDFWGDGQKTIADAAHDIVLDHVYVHGLADQPLRRCVMLNSASTAIVDSWIGECHDAGADAQAIGGWNGPGPFLIDNNELDGSTENVMFGGSDAGSAELSPADITLTHNHIAKPLAWKGGPWAIKAIFELKNAKRLLAEGNVFEGNWPQAWTGEAITFKSVNQSGTAPWSGTTDVTFRHNLIRNAGAGINMHSGPEPAKPYVPMARVAVTDNLFVGLNSPTYPGSAKGVYLGGAIADLVIDHNTFTWASDGRAIEFEGDPPQPFAHLRITNNLFATVAGMGMTGQGLGYPGPVWAAWGATGEMTGNLIAVGAAFGYGGPGGLWNSYPPGNRMLFNEDAQFTPIGFAPDWSLSSASPWKGFAAGRDPGADVAAVLVATAGVVEGRPGASPTPTPTPNPTPIPAPSITLAQLKAAIVALQKVTGPSGREAQSVKAPLVPALVYLKALAEAIPSAPVSAKRKVTR